MPLDETLREDVLKHADIVKVVSSYLPLIKKGKNYFAKCPFHDDTNPSLTISPDKQIFKCFVCGTSGNAISFVSKYEHISFVEAMKKVAEICDYHDPRLQGIVKAKPVDNRRTPLIKCIRDLTLYYQFALSTEEGKEGLEYFNSRKLDSEFQKKYLLGFANRDGKATCQFLQSKGHSLKTIEDIGIATNINGTFADKNQGRVIFPICDSDGDVVGFSARRLKDGPEAKYVNSPETYLFHKSSILYNYHIAKEKCHTAGFVYVLEGFMDVFALAKIGIDSAVAIMGTALSAEHIQMLRALNVEIRLCLDCDLPGQKAMMEISKALTNAGINFRIVSNPGTNKDPDELLNTQGPDALRAFLNNLVSRVDFALNYFKNVNPLQTIEQKKALIKEFIPILLSVKHQLELDSYLVKLAGITGFEAESIRNLLNSAKQDPARNAEEIIATYHPERKLLRKLEAAERELLYQMTINKSATAFYEEKVGAFYIEIYRAIADFIIGYAQKHEELNPIDMVSSLEESPLENKEELIKEITSLVMERNHPNDCDQQLLSNLLSVITEEKEKIYENDIYNQSTQGKTSLEQARILYEYNKRKLKKIK